MTHHTRRAWLKSASVYAGTLALARLAHAASSLPQETVPRVIPTEDEAAKMAAIVRKFMESFSVPGLSLAIACQGQQVYGAGFGFGDQDRAERVTPRHLFRIASVSKPITSAAIYTYFDQGLVKLDDLVFGPGGHLESEYGSLAGELEKKITVHHLLTHTAGAWGNDRNDPMFLNPAMDHHALISWTLQHQRIEREPGQRYAYSNFGYSLLGRILEKVSGRPYADCIQQQLLEKCGIRDMRIAQSKSSERAANEVVYYQQGGGDPYRMNIPRMDSHGGWLATADDLVKFAVHVDGFATTPDLLSAAALKAMTAAPVASPTYASGWSVNKYDNWWHLGSMPGTTSILVRTHTGLCWAALANTRTKGIDSAIDGLMWKVVKAVPAWNA